MSTAVPALDRRRCSPRHFLLFLAFLRLGDASGGASWRPYATLSIAIGSADAHPASATQSTPTKMGNLVGLSPKGQRQARHSGYRKRWLPRHISGKSHLVPLDSVDDETLYAFTGQWLEVGTAPRDGAMAREPGLGVLVCKLLETADR